MTQWGEMCTFGNTPSEHLSAWRTPSGVRISVAEGGTVSGYTLTDTEARELMEAVGRALGRWSS